MPQKKGLYALRCVFYGIVTLLHVMAVDTEQETLHELSRRSTNSTLSFLPANFPVGNLKNATAMACSDVITIPSIRLVQMTTAQMKAMLEDMGGSYVKEYMAATPEEAAVNFPNLIKLSELFQNSSKNLSVSVYDNFVTKQVIVEDLQKLMFYFLNKTTANGHAAMGMKTVTSVNNFSTTPGRNTKPLTPSTYPTPVPIYTKGSTKKSSIKYPTLPPTLHNTTNVQATTHMVTQSNTEQTTVHSKQTIGTNGPTMASDSSSRDGTLPTAPTSTPTAATAATRTASSSTVTTTMDPEVAKSLQQFRNYLNGEVFGDLGTNLTSKDLDRVWREANTTLHPGTLLGLVPADTRIKRAAVQYDDALTGSYTREEYCQLRGALTSDRKYVHLCSSCAATTRLSGEYFPRYVNEVVCKQDDPACFTVGGAVHGQCKQNMFTLKLMRRRRGHCSVVLHNGEKLAVDDWQIFPKAMRVACECTINKLSVFKQYVG